MPIQPLLVKVPMTPAQLLALASWLYHQHCPYDAPEVKGAFTAVIQTAALVKEIR